MQAVCGSVYELEAVSPAHSVRELKAEIRERLGMEEEYQLLSFGGKSLEQDDKLLCDLFVNENTPIQLQYDLDGAGDDDAMCYVCCIIKVQGGGCGCCPVKRWGFCWEEWPEEENNDESGAYQLTCSLI